jgi:AraC-like DNA-binding protein
MASLWRVMETCGIDPAPMFAAEGIEVRLPIQPGSRVDYAKVDRIRARAAQLCGDPAFGLRVAKIAHPSHFGALGYAWMASSTLRQGLGCLHRYVRVLNDHAQVTLEERPGVLLVKVSVSESSADQVARDDSHLAALTSLCRLNVGPSFRPAWVGMSHPEPADISPYQQLFNCELRWGCESPEFAIRTEDADRMLPSANPVLEQMNERIVMKRLGQLDKADTVGRVRAAILEQLPAGNISDESVAAALHMTSRTLHRRLKERECSFRGLLKEVRQELAAQYIEDDSLTLTEITFLLGFSEMSSFSRAFKNWNGVSPSEARQTVH